MADTERWVERYHALLTRTGIKLSALQPPTNAANTIDLHPAITLDDCLSDPEPLRAWVAARAGDTADPRRLRAQASVLQQEMALTMIAPLVMQLFTTGKAPLPYPQRIRLQQDASEETVGNWQWLGNEEMVGVDQFAASVATRVKAWYPLFRQHLGVAPGAYWSSIGLALCAPFSALYDKAPPQQLCDEASDWLNTIDCDARRYIDWIPAVFNEQQMAIPQRRGCCLKFLLPEGGYCGTCGIYRSERMAIKTQARQPTTPIRWSPEQ